MTKVDAIKKVLENHNGIATWQIIYNEIESHYPAIKSSDEWEAGIRGVLYREIRNNKNFKRVGLSMYALTEYQTETIEEIQQDTVRMHSYMEGICIEIGNFLNLNTFTADPTAEYNKLSLSNIATLKTIPEFTYPEIVKTTKRIDVMWFNKKGFEYPKRAIEIVDSIGTLEPALKRSLQLIEFNLQLYILCKKEHIKKVEKELLAEPYIRVRERYVVRDYDSILDVYSNPIASMKDDFLQIKNHF